MAAFTAKKVSKVKGVDADASYSVEGADGGSFAIASNKKELKQLMTSDAAVVYDEKKGKLYLNDNGTAKGWGTRYPFISGSGLPCLLFGLDQWMKR